MTWIPKAAPKPKVRGKPRKGRAPLKKVRMKSRGKKGAAFPKVKNKPYRDWIRTLPCLLRGTVIGVSISPNDVSQGLAWRGFVHGCWGPIDPAHVGTSQARGAPDVGHCVPLCRAAHSYYDEHRASWCKVTAFDGERLAVLAERYESEWVARTRAPETP